MILSDTRILEEIEKETIKIVPYDRECLGSNSYDVHLGKTLATYREHILDALRETGWVVGGPKGAAALLGMKRSMLYWKMKKLGISRPE